ncbi:hypothetical protein [Pseudomonas sp. Snoq117.2]|uniref:hypothetical protein n=1 Tax=Pseudomonas sp. Snoq117.2 TaxID=1500302 RepID=UPI0008AD52DC|nr:hypothetical protein [Pseudomonas sp. Snoq117.2]SEP41275.1 hypothetical protein SAMN02787149_110101 [Pseudomonas sp. Snoq117.2]
MTRFSDFDEDIDTFDRQQQLFQPCQLRYARNLVDLLTDEASTLRELLAKYRQDNLELLAQLDEARTAVYRTRSEYMAWHSYQNACRTSGTERGNRLLPIIPEVQAEHRHHVLTEELSRLKAELATTRIRLQQAEVDVHGFRAELRHRQGRP